jgi:GT2 family glycosyltransferase
MSLAISIVLYNNGIELERTIECILRSQIDLKLFLIDNSETDNLRRLDSDPRITYIFNGANLGYGAAHNVALRHSMQSGISYHIVMNPDITFQKGALEQMTDYMEANQDVGSMMPKIFNEDGSLQRLCKLLPTPFNLIGRRFLRQTAWAARQNKRYELQHFNYDHILNTPCLSGCFMFVRTSVLKQTGLFDERYFMYLEDYDLNRRINIISKTVFYPEASVVHVYSRGSYKDKSLLRMHIRSAIQYFNKWGWFRDAERSRLNDEVLRSIDLPN